MISEVEQMKIKVINGPNLNMLGIREPAIYGNQTYADLQKLIEDYAMELGIKVDVFQSNCEGFIIDEIQSCYQNFDAIVINPAGYTHTSVALRDSVACALVPIVEVHISNIVEREEFRHVSLLTDVCAHSIIGKGTDGYLHAVEWLLNV